MLAQTAQTDFSAGMFQSVARHLIPANGAYDIVNGLLDDSGSIYKRGGSDWHTTVLSGSTALTSIWDGRLGAGYRTVVSSPAQIGVLDASDAAIVGVNGTGAPVCRPVECNGALVYPAGIMFAGSRKASGYTTGTITVTAGSSSVTGSGTSWSTNVDPGMFLQSGGHSYVIATVTSDTGLTLTAPATAAGSGAYAIATTATAGKVAEVYAVIPAGGLNRLVACAGNKVFFSAPGDSYSFAATDYQELPEGADIIAAVNLGDNLLVFATNGLWIVTGMALDLVDDFGNPQQRLNRVSPDLLIWDAAGISAWANRLVVPALDGIWLIDGVSSPVQVSEPIATLYRSYVKAGYSPGQSSVIRGHFILPILSGTTVIATLVCRLDQKGFPWSRLATTNTGYAVRSRADEVPVLLGAGPGRVADCTWLDPDTGNTTDADGSPVTLAVTTRRYTTGQLASNMIRRMRATYEMTGDSSAISASVGVGHISDGGGASWGMAHWGGDDWSDDTGEFVLLSGSAPPGEGTDPFSWPVNRRTRFVSYRLDQRQPTSRLVLRTVEQFTRPTTQP